MQAKAKVHKEFLATILNKTKKIITVRGVRLHLADWTLNLAKFFKQID